MIEAVEWVVGVRGITATPCQAHQLPQPYRHLLDHKGNMTPRLAQFHNVSLDKVRLAVLDSSIVELVPKGERLLQRRVVLHGPDFHLYEVGAIRIFVDRLPERIRDEVLKATKPLGSLLLAQKVDQTSRVEGFFQTSSFEVVVSELKSKISQISIDCSAGEAFGRKNVLVSSTGVTLAEVIELIPPM